MYAVHVQCTVCVISVQNGYGEMVLFMKELLVFIIGIGIIISRAG
jgi:hypothetical protein